MKVSCWQGISSEQKIHCEKSSRTDESRKMADKTKINLRTFGFQFACKQLGSCLSVLTRSKKLTRLKYQQLFLDPQRGVRVQGKSHPLDRGDTSEYRSRGLTRYQTHRQKLTWKLASGQEHLNCDEWVEAQCGPLRIKNSRGRPVTGGAQIL